MLHTCHDHADRRRTVMDASGQVFESNAKSNSKSNSKSKPKSNSKSNSKSNPKSNSKSNSKSNPKSNAKSNPKSKHPNQLKKLLKQKTDRIVKTLIHSSKTLFPSYFFCYFFGWPNVFPQLVRGVRPCGDGGARPPTPGFPG